MLMSKVLVGRVFFKKKNNWREQLMLGLEGPGKSKECLAEENVSLVSKGALSTHCPPQPRSSLGLPSF